MQIVQQEEQAPPDGTVEEQSPQNRSNSSEPAFFDLQHRAPVKEQRTADELAAMILSDLQQVGGCPPSGVIVTVYGLSPWNSWLHFGAAAGAVHNKQELQEFCTLLTDRLRVRYDIA